MKLNKKGFTLIELLAVIIILAVLMLIAVPGIINMMNKSKVNAFRSQSETIYKAAQNQAASELAEGNNVTCYARINGTESVTGSETALDLDGNNKIDYKATIDASGKVTELLVYDRSGKYSISGDGEISSLSDATVGENVSSSTVTSGCPSN